MKWPVVAEMILLVAVVDVNLFARGAGVEAVHLVVFHAPGTVELGNPRQLRLHLGMGQVKAGAAPGGVVGRAIRALHKPILTVGVFRVLIVPAKRQPPQAEGQAGFFDPSRHRRDAMRIRPVGPDAIKSPARAVEMPAVLPFIVNLHDAQTERLEFFGGKLGKFFRGLFITRRPMLFRIPSAIGGGARPQGDLVLLFYGIRIKLFPLPGVVENADGQSFKLGGSPGGDLEMTIVNPGLERHSGVLNTGKKHPATPVFGEPARHHAAPRARIGARQEQITTGIFVGRGQACGTHRAEFAGGFAEVEGKSGGNRLGQVNILVAWIVAGAANQHKRQLGIQLQ